MDQEEIAKLLAGAGASGEKPKAAPSSDSGNDAMAELLKGLVAKMNEGFEALNGKIHDLDKNVGRVRGMVKGASGSGAGDGSNQGDGAPAKPAQDSKGSAGGASFVEAMRLGRMLEKLPEAARSQIEAHIAEGGSISATLSALELANTINGGEKPKAEDSQAAAETVVIEGQSATPANIGAPSHPSTLQEYVALVQSQEPADKQKVQALIKDNNFDPDSLPNG